MISKHLVTFMTIFYVHLVHHRSQMSYRVVVFWPGVWDMEGWGAEYVATQFSSRWEMATPLTCAPL